MEDDSDSVVYSLLETVADAERVDPVDLPPLSDAVDPEALNALARPVADERSPVTVQFEYCGYAVEVVGPGRVTVEPLDLATAADTAAGTATGAGEESLAE